MIYIQTPTETVTGGITTRTWALYQTLRAESNAQSGIEFYSASQVQDKKTTLFRCRYTPNITQKMRIVFGEHAYNIEAVNNVFGRNHEMLILASIMPQEYEQFALSGIGRTGTLPGSITFAWTSEMPSTSRVRWKETAPVPAVDWTYGTHTTTKVFSHSVTQDGFKASTSYSYAVYSENANGWTPGWSASGTFSMNADDILVA
jgi:SPP1 family predicted phage head-tail adaptor